VDTFRVVASNLRGSATSASATLTVVNSAPTILLPLISQAVLEGATAVFSVEAIGSQPLGYQWQLNGTNIAGATQAGLNLADVTAANAGSYQVVVSNAFGASLSSAAILTRLSSLVVGWGDNSYGETNMPVSLTNVTSIAAGYGFSLALQGNGTVGAWGYNGDGETNVPVGLSNVAAIAAGSYHCLALGSNGTVTAWGNNGYGQTTVPAGLSNVVAIAGGEYFSLALQGTGTVVAWGDNTYGQTTVPAGLDNVVAVAAGLYHCLALQSDGTVVAWGDNTFGETNVPAGLSDVVAIAGGASYSLALQKNETVVAWGYDYYGQTNVPTGLGNVVAIAAGLYHGLALRGNGTVVAWGDDGSGQTNVPSGLGNVVAIAAGENHSLALVDDGAPFFARQPLSIAAYSGGTAVLSAGIVGASPLSYQWQSNGTNIVGATNATLTVTGLEPNNTDVFRVMVTSLLGTTTSAGATIIVANSAPIVLVPPASQAVLAGANTSFSVGATGSEPLAYQWQFNGTNIAGATQASLNLSDVIAADAGNYRVEVSNAFGTTLSPVAVLTQLGSILVGWGDNSYGEATELRGLSNVSAIAAGVDFSLALQGNGTVAAWGYDYNGQTNVPAGLSNVAAIAAGSYHCLALQSNGTVVAWGDNSSGETNVPPGLSSVVAIAGGLDFSLALQANGRVVAWGDNDSGQTNVPVGLSNVVAIAGGGEFSLALQADGTVVAWGDDTYGETNVPAGLSNVVAIAAGSDFSLALQANGAVVGWGGDTYGQSTPPAALSNVVSIAAGQDFSSLALQADGTVVAWGNNGYGETNVPPGLSNVVAIAAGALHSLALVNNGSPFIARQPVGTDLYSGASDFLSAGIVGGPPLSYQWQLNGTNIVGATNSTLALTGLQTNNAGVFRVVVSNSLGTATSAGTTVAVTNSAPIILIPPASQSVVAGDHASVVFSVGATGSLPLDYQWQFDGTNIAGATQDTLNLPNVTAANVGTYWVVVSNAFGSTPSSGAALTQLNSMVLAWGDGSSGETSVPAGLNDVVAISGGLDFSLALQANGKVMAWGDNALGQVNVPAGLSNVVAIAAGSYHGLALQSNGTVVAWGNNTVGQTAVPAALSSVAAIAAGSFHSLALQSNGTVVAWGYNNYGQTNVPRGLSNVVAIAAGQFFSLALQVNGTVVAWGYGGSGETNVPTDLNSVVAIAAGGSFSLALQGNGAVAAWGNNVYGQTKVPAGLSNVVAIAAGNNFGLALQTNGTIAAWGDNTYGETTAPTGLSNVVAIAAGQTHSLALVNDGSPFIARQPVGSEGYSGGTAILGAGIVGTPQLSYQWQVNGTNVTGATDAMLTLTGLETNEVDTFRVTVSNSMGTATSANATLTVVNSAPIILVQPASQSLELGDNAIFSVGATGSQPLSYQWQFNGTNITGATQAELDLPDLNANNAGNFRVLVSNAFGTALSLVATLSFTEPNAIFSNRTVIAGSSNTVTGSNEFATNEPGEPDIAGNPGGSSVWWEWTAQASGMATVDTFGSSFDTLLAVYTGSSVSNLTLVASDDDYGQLLTSLVTFAATAGTTYQIRVDGFDGANGAIVLTVSELPPGPPSITVPIEMQTADLGGCATFSVIAAGLGPLSYEWLMNGAIIAGATQSTLSIDNLQASNATTYSVIVSNAYGGVTNSASLSLVAGPPNDAFVNAIVLAGPSQIVTGSNESATKEPGEPDDGGNAGGRSVWWVWTAPLEGPVMLDTTGSSFETLLAVYTGDVVSNLTLIANDDGDGGYRTYFGSHVVFSAEAGTVYHIAVDGYGGASGSILLSAQLPGTALSNNIVLGSGKLLADGQFQLSVTNGITGQSYTLLASTNLVNWIPALVFTSTNSPMVIYDPMAASFKQRFYKIAP
jgi:alpha-tubulin suppressor-like RCC1 family protein